MSAPKNASMRRGACPGLTAPMQTGDGLLVRLTPSGDSMALDTLMALCAAARRHGNGIIEVTARGNIQVRGLTPDSAPAFADEIAALRIAAPDGVPILADPLAGLDPDQIIDANALVAALRRRLAAAPFAHKLGPKVAVLIDGGAALHLDAVAADVRLRALPASGGARIHVALGGDAAGATPIGAVAAADAVETVVRLLATIAQDGPMARAHGMVRAGRLEAFRMAVAELLIDAPAPPARPRSEPIGSHRLRDGQVGLGIGLAFGHSDAATLEHLIDAAKHVGAVGLRTAPGRALIAIGMTPRAARSVAANAERLGFIVQADDPRRHVVACAGAPICASAKIPARTLAPAISKTAAYLLDGSITIHISGCPKGCAHATAAALTIVGGERGCDLVADGRARDRPLGAIPKPELPAAIAQESARASLPGERAVDTLGRLGAARLAALLGEPMVDSRG
jgi:precorrin-3B synthase